MRPMPVHSTLSALLREYSKHSLETMAAAHSGVAQQAASEPSTPESPASCLDPWQKLMKSLPKERKTELQEIAKTLINQWKGRSFNKSKLTNNVKHTLFDYEYKPSMTDKFFVLWAANGDTFAFKYSKWIFYACKEKFTPSKCRITTIDKTGKVIGLSTSQINNPIQNTYLAENPWMPLKARGNYKKEDLMEIAREIGIEDSGTANTIYQRLVADIHSLPLTN